MNERTNKIRAQMDSIIAANNFSVKQRYPIDCEIDTEIIESIGTSSGLLAWSIGDSHTHMSILGIHPRENEMVHCYSRLTRDDKLFRIALNGAEDFKIVEMNRQQFDELSQTPIPYSIKSSASKLEFDLFKHERRIATVKLKSDVDKNGPYFKANVAMDVPNHGIDKVAVRIWTEYQVRAIVHSMFFRLESVITSRDDASTIQNLAPSKQFSTADQQLF